MSSSSDKISSGNFVFSDSSIKSIPSWYFDLDKFYDIDEEKQVKYLLDYASEAFSKKIREKSSREAENLVDDLREDGISGLVDEFIKTYELSTQEGILLLCIAEALLRVPDNLTIDALIDDKMSDAHWEKYFNNDGSWLMQMATAGLWFSSSILVGKDESRKILSSIVRRMGRPALRSAVRLAMKVIGEHFILGTKIEKALSKAKKKEKEDGTLFSFDMLGEAAQTATDVKYFFQKYKDAIEKVGNASSKEKSIYEKSSISVKLSALHERYYFEQRDRVISELLPRLIELAKLARDKGVALTIDAEESYRLTLMVEIFKETQKALGFWGGLGIVIQAYQKRSFALIDLLAKFAKNFQTPIPVRLVKGAYWDTEVKHAQVMGYKDYPVFTRKSVTDLSYLCCAHKLLSNKKLFYPRFATHNGHTLVFINSIAKSMGIQEKDYEFQRLQGMGMQLYDRVRKSNLVKRPCRVYAPVGFHKTLLPYLIRRLLENGANSSFVNKIFQKGVSSKVIVQDPIGFVENLSSKRSSFIPLPKDLYGDRLNSSGFDLSNVRVAVKLGKALYKAHEKIFSEEILVKSSYDCKDGKTSPIVNPSTNQKIGHWVSGGRKTIEASISKAQKGHKEWSAKSIEYRASVLEKAADIMESKEYSAKLMSLCIKEAGKSIPDAIAELREAVDFLRYYAMQAKSILLPQVLQGPTGEYDQLELRSRGIFVCISPWNFPFAIFLGQVCAALVTGNSVIAKPAEQTPLVAREVVKIMHMAGVTKEALVLLLGEGHVIGKHLTSDPRVSGVAFTGSCEAARSINMNLASRKGAIIPLIAETGGQNFMVVDSSSLHEQVVRDAVLSAFGSAGQRCSCLRVLLVQKEVYKDVEERLVGAMKELSIGDPSLINVDLGPLIDKDAVKRCVKHQSKMRSRGKLLYSCRLDKKLKGTFYAPRVYKLNSFNDIGDEVFGPVLHIMPYKGSDLHKIADKINALGYGLTFGMQTRVNSRIDQMYKDMKVGNFYVNRNIIGATVGVQPFGGEGNSGTGPKAGGPNYLFRFCSEHTLSIDTTAAGGNASLMSMDQW